jgi:CubicO group peptidase (beta-lactamase class C family)
MKHILISIVCCFEFLIISAQQKFTQPVQKSIDAISRSQQWAGEIPGLTVGVIINNKIVFKENYGVQSVETGQPLTSVSDFHMASVSKPFVATAILQLVKQGKLSLDSTIVHYLPYFQMKDARYRQITLYQVLTHSSGIPDVIDYEWNNPQTDSGAAERYVRSFDSLQLDFAPGSKFSYSNAAFDLMADVIAKASGMSFEKYISTNILSPLGMTNSSFLLDEISAGRRTSPHIINDSLSVAVSTIYPYNRIHAPSSTLHSNIDDMLRWANLFLNEGKAGSIDIIDKSTWLNMLKPRLPVQDNFKVCLSWFRTKIGTRTVYFHSGGDLGYGTFIGFVPDAKVAVVLMGNNTLFDPAEFALVLLNSILLPSRPVKPVQKPIHLLLKNYILKNGIAKTKQVYYRELQQHPRKYLYDASSVGNLGDWLVERKYYQQAVETFLFCTEIEPANAIWKEYVGDTYAALAQKENALKWFKKALAVNRSNQGLQKKIADLGIK